MLLAIFLYKRWQEPVKKESFDRSPDELIYTKHAICRMDCRKIREDDINDILEKGIINLNWSNRNSRPCPTYALQGVTNDGEKLRVIFAQCDEVTKVVTCDNLNEDFECHCPGDEKKN